MAANPTKNTVIRRYLTENPALRPIIRRYGWTRWNTVGVISKDLSEERILLTKQGLAGFQGQCIAAGDKSNELFLSSFDKLRLYKNNFFRFDKL